MKSRPSTLPTKPGTLLQERVRSLAQLVALARLLTDRQQTEPRLVDAEADPAYSRPMSANCTSHSGDGSMVAPASTSSCGCVPGHGDRDRDRRAGARP